MADLVLVRRIPSVHTSFHSMKIADTSRPGPFQPIQHTIYIPDDSKPLPSGHTKELLTGLTAFVGKETGAGGVAWGAWKLTTIPHSKTIQELTNILLENNVSPEKAPVFANEIRQLLCNPWVRTLLFGVAGGAVAYATVETRPWSPTKKWLVTVGGVVVFSALYLVLRHYGILR